MTAMTKATVASSRTRRPKQESRFLVTLDPISDTERLVKSVERVRDLGEVFTPAETVQAMLDLLPDAMWSPHPSPTFLEPSCGDGNFIVAILDRKLDRLRAAWEAGELPAGASRDALQFHALEAIASIYAVDISVDNIVGGTPGHEVGARDRLLGHLRDWFTATIGRRLTERSPLLRCAQWIVERNVQIANMLPFNADGSPSGRDTIPIVEYSWSPIDKSVSLSTTTLGAVMAAADEDTGQPTLFGAPAPTAVWSGKSARLHEAPVPAPAPQVLHVRNGAGSRSR
jgi:hypothetical protein